MAGRKGIWPAGLAAAVLSAAWSGAALAQGALPASGPPDWTAFKAHADKAHAIAGETWKATADYFCSTGIRVNAITDPPIEPTRLFDNVWALGDEGTVVYAVVTPEGIVLIDASYPTRTDALLAQMARAGLDPAQVKYVLINHGHQDHYGGSGYFQARSGAKVVLSAVDWDMIAKAKAAPGTPAPKHDVDAEDGKPITVGGMAFTPVFIPGHTPGSLGWIFPVSEGGKTHLAAEFGSSILRTQALTADNLAQELHSWEKFAAIAHKMKVDVELQNHPFFDNMPDKLKALAARQPGQPNPFVVGAASYGHFTGAVVECLKADIARKGGKVPD